MRKNKAIYMPLMMGDWLRGTNGMKAEVRGVYISLLIHQFDHGSIPDDLESLALIDPEVGKVWVSLKHKFSPFEVGRLQNAKLEEVRDFWQKQKINGLKGGRPKKNNPKGNPKHNPTDNPKGNLHIDSDYDSDNELKLKEYDAWTELILDGSDQFFNVMFQNAKIPPGEHIAFWVADHRDLLNRYPKMRPPTQQAFRQSCMKHLNENHKKPVTHGKLTDKKQQQREAGREYLKKHYGDTSH